MLGYERKVTNSKWRARGSKLGLRRLKNGKLFAASVYCGVFCSYRHSIVGNWSTSCTSQPIRKKRTVGVGFGSLVNNNFGGCFHCLVYCDNETRPTRLKLNVGHPMSNISKTVLPTSGRFYFFISQFLNQVL